MEGILFLIGIPVGLILAQILMQKYLGNQIRSFINGVGLIAILFWLFNSGNDDDQNVITTEKTENSKIEKTTTNSVNSFYSNNNLKTTQKKKRVEYNYNSRTYSKPINKKESRKIRVGAICNDGTKTTATGRGACSHHGGVAYWLVE